MDRIMWQPWIGPAYRESKLLILGESCYDWVDDGETNYPQPDHPSLVVNEAQVAPGEGSLTMRKLTRALANCQTPTPAQASQAWNRVAYTNYIPVSVGFGADKRPTQSMWAQAEAEWPTLLETLKPNVVIVLGLKMWSRMPTTHSVVSETIQAYRLENGDLATCHATNHPSRGPAWAHYAAFIAQALPAATS
jgi:hypothetical protein